MTLRLILSGGIGSGKSAVAELLAERGAEVIEADSVGHAILEPGGDVFRDVAELWPQVVENGRIDRRKLGRIVFADEAQLRRLEAITHPAIRARIAEAVTSSTAAVIVVELPILTDMLGPGWRRVIVDAPDAVRRGRLRARGLDESEIARRMAAQPTRESWLAAADELLDNGGDLALLRRQVDALVGRLWSINE